MFELTAGTSDRRRVLPLVVFTEAGHIPTSWIYSQIFGLGEYMVALFLNFQSGTVVIVSRRSSS
jgi:hypothetical protein